MSASIHPALTRALNRAVTRVLDVDTPHRYVFFSDQHRGAGDQADEFDICRPAYRSALLHYLVAGYTLVLVGDVEELWENAFREVFAQHGEVIDLEAAFGPGRYLRIHGNHDDGWSIARRVTRDLGPRMPDGASVAEAVRFTIKKGGAERGTVIVLHGHQGTLDSDRLAWLARPALRYLWRPIAQNFFGIGRQSPSADLRLRAEHDRDMYQWAASQPKLILIAGHTHRPVWAARTHLQRLEAEIAELERHPRPGDPEWETRLAQARVDAERKRAESPPELEGEDDRFRPCYFNTGCCKFSDGDITGIEIENGEIRLVKWAAPGRGHEARRIPLEAGDLAQFFEEL
jgi:hypothetical protein